jgi:ABC-type phosphate transport system permease subunit
MNVIRKTSNSGGLGSRELLSYKQVIVGVIIINIIIIIIIISFMQDIYTYVPEAKLCPLAIQCCSYYVVTVRGAYNAIYYIISIALLHQHFPQYACSAQYGCFL